MKNKNLKALLSAMQSDASTGEFENLTADHADKIRGGLSSSNGTCSNGTCGGSNGTCSNGTCGGSSNGSCNNGKSFY
ncbi:MAG: hypothetical protein NWR72_05200 [Bacteroidia bacterium]|nr:hypothetical protein [Bacteroidia bacterium]